jgi:hypothetical protein
MGNAFHQCFYWPTAVADASEIVRTCEGCQFYARKSNLPAHVLQTIPVTWPFAVWGLVLTPKIGTGKGLACGPSLVKKRHSAGKSPQRIR